MKAPPFTALAARLGIDLDAVREPEPNDGLVIQPCYNEPDGTLCEGSLRLVERAEPICTLRCDTCDFEAGIPARKLNPEISRRRRIEQAEIPHRFLGVRFEQDDGNRDAIETVRSWLAGADENPVGRATSLIPAPALWGHAGRGKSHLLAAVASRLVRELDLHVLFRSARQLLRELQQFEDPKARELAWRRAVSVDVLCLDDLGAQQDTDWRNDQLADLVDERYQRELPIVVATNYAPSAWERIVDERTHSRLKGMTFGVELRGVDRRLNQEERG